MKRFSQEEKIWIKDNYKHKSINEMCSFLERTEASVKGFLNKNKLKNSFDYSRPNNIGLENEKLCYLLGFIWADGYISEKGYIELTILNSDGQQILPVIQYIEGFKIRLNNRKNKKTTISFISRNKDFVSMLLNLKFNNKSYCEPTELLQIMPKNNHYLFWRGLFDGDGCIYDQKTSATKVSKRIEISGQYDYQWTELSKLLENLNCSFCIKKSDTLYGKNSLIKIWRKADVIKFSEYIYADGGINGCLTRKKIKFY